MTGSQFLHYDHVSCYGKVSLKLFDKFHEPYKNYNSLYIFTYPLAYTVIKTVVLFTCFRIPPILTH